MTAAASATMSSYTTQLSYPVPATQLLTPTPTSVSKSCCEGGRPIMTDPSTGQTVCSCQYTPSLLSYPRVAGLAEGVYGQPGYGATQAYVPFGSDPSAFYTSLSSGYGLKENGEAWRSVYQPVACYPYDSSQLAHVPYHSFPPLDINGARRKNATRESTSTLKAWLQEHIKNPYPTKGEKIMLAIITKMTLTQVSTWFANARRRLKKENKMTWSPRNRCDDDDDDDDDPHVDSDIEVSDDDRIKQVDSDAPPSPSPITNNERPETPPSTSADESHTIHSTNNVERVSTTHSTDVVRESTKSRTNDNVPDNLKSTSDKLNAPKKESVSTKPRIWSLAHTATSNSPPPNRRSPVLRQGHHAFTTPASSIGHFSAANVPPYMPTPLKYGGWSLPYSVSFAAMSQAHKDMPLFAAAHAHSMDHLRTNDDKNELAPKDLSIDSKTNPSINRTLRESGTTEPRIRWRPEDAPPRR